MKPAILVRRAAWPLLVVAVALVPLVPPLLAGHTLAWRDTLRMYVPQYRFVAEALRHGTLPLWDPRDGTGTPLFARYGPVFDRIARSFKLPDAKPAP